MVITAEANRTIPEHNIKREGVPPTKVEIVADMGEADFRISLALGGYVIRFPDSIKPSQLPKERDLSVDCCFSRDDEFLAHQIGDGIARLLSFAATLEVTCTGDKVVFDLSIGENFRSRVECTPTDFPDLFKVGDEKAPVEVAP